MNRCRKHVLAIASISVGLLAAAPAWAGTYSKVNQSDWQQGVTGLPTYVNMYIYLPTTPASKPPIVVFPHQCTGTAQESHGAQGSLEKIADTSGFIIIYPEATGENCWDAGSTRSLKHGGGGDTGAIVQMVKYTVSKYSADANRVYVTGPSSGAIMTEALLGVYPDVFMGGISMMGVPCGCWASGYNDTVGSGNTDQWAGPCASGTVTHTGKEWGDLVRSYFPEYGNKHRPRLQHWHGATDTTLNYKNVAEDIKEWTNLLGLSETPTATEQNTPKSGTTHQYWKNSCYTVYETFVLANTGHAVSVDANTITKYFGLDKAGAEDPETAACPGAVPGGGGSSTGTGGASGAGGGTGAGGATGAGGDRDGGAGGRDGGGREVGTPGSGGAQATGGSAGGGGAVQSGGRSGSGGAQGTGGVVGSGGASTKGGASGSGGAVGSGGSAVGTGGSVGSGGEGQGGKQGNGGSTTPSGSSGGSTTSGSSGGCAIGGRAGHSASTLGALLLAAFALVFRRQRRPRR